MKVFRIAVLAISAFLAFSCATAKYSAGVSPEVMEPMAVIEPIADIYYLQDSYHSAEFSSELSVKSSEVLAQAIKSVFPQAKDVLMADMSDTPDDVVKQIVWINSFIPANSNVPVPPAIRRLLLQEGYRYGVLAFHTGFTMNPKSYRRELALGLTLGIATALITLGYLTLYSVPQRYGSDIYLMVVDAQEDKILFFEHPGQSESDPLSLKHLTKRLARMMRHF